MCLPRADGAEPVGGQRTWGDDVHDDGLALGGAAPGGLVMVDTPPTAVGVRPVDRRGSLVARPRLRTRALGDEFEANCGKRSRALDCTGTAALHARRRSVRPATAAAISHPWRNGAAPRGAIRPSRRGDREWQQRTGSGGNFRVFRSNSNRCVFNCKY